MEKTKSTKFYILNCGTLFQFTKFEALELSDAIADQNSLLDTEDNFVKIWLSDWNKWNLLYIKTLLSKFVLIILKAIKSMINNVNI